MVNDSLPDPLTARLLDQHVDPINQEDGSHSPGTLLQSSRQGLRSQLLQRDSDRDSNTPQDLLLSRTQLTSTGGHEQDEDEYDDEYDDDEATSETQPVLMSKSTRMKATDKRRRTPGKQQAGAKKLFLGGAREGHTPCMVNSLSCGILLMHEGEGAQSPAIVLQTFLTCGSDCDRLSGPQSACPSRRGGCASEVYRIPVCADTTLHLLPCLSSERWSSLLTRKMDAQVLHLLCCDHLQDGPGRVCCD